LVVDRDANTDRVELESVFGNANFFRVVADRD